MSYKVYTSTSDFVYIDVVFNVKGFYILEVFQCCKYSLPYTEEKRRRIVTESHPKLLSSLRPSLANRLGPSPLNNPSSRKSSDHTKR